MLGTSVAMETVRDLLDRVAGGGAPTVLITGESGTGKEVAAQRLHARGPRAEGPFVEVDCASIPAELMEGTLFGHEPGAFTDARETRIGLLELGQGGTVFLDEIGELEAGLQAKLLRVLDSRRFRRLGGSEEIELDVHLVAATNRDLAAEVEAGAFRADLFYRLDVVRVELPPLRDRGEDVLLLARRFLGEAARRLGKEARGFAPAVEEDLLRHRWPGNVRELRNHMERLALAVDPAAGRVEDAGLEVRPPREEDRIHVDFSAGPVRFETIERHVLTEALRAAEGNVSEAARLLGLGRGALRYRLQRLETEGESPAADEAA
jgi:two-component system response regulator HydG